MSKMNISIAEKWFDLINNGSKTIEGRLNKEKYKTLKEDDIVILYVKDTNKKIKIKIIKINNYDNFGEMLEKEGLENVLPDPSIKTIKDGINVYRKYYTIDDEEKYGVLALKIINL